VNLAPSAFSKRLLGRLARDQSGATAVVIAICMTVLMGFAGMAIDAVHWYADRRLSQNTADAAAFSGAKDYLAGDTSAGVTANARAVAAQYGLTNGVNGVTVAVNMPPATGPNTATTGAVEVIVTKTESLFFSSFYVSSASVTARAVAVSGSGGAGPYCVETLKNAAIIGANLNNGITLDVSNCGLADDATGSSALSVIGGAVLKAKTLSVSGSESVNNGGSLQVSGANLTNQPAVADPYASVAIPAAGTCAPTNSFMNGGQTTTISPGTYCGGLSIGNNNNVIMTAGTYIVNGGTFQVQGGVTVTATAGVTIVLTGSTGVGWATPNIANGATFNLTAPSSGPLSGMAIIVDRAAPDQNSMSFAGGASFVVTGAIYAPTQTISFSNGTTNSASCTQLIAGAVNFSGGARFDNQCAGVGVTGIGATSTALVE